MWKAVLTGSHRRNEGIHEAPRSITSWRNKNHARGRCSYCPATVRCGRLRTTDWSKGDVKTSLDVEHNRSCRSWRRAHTAAMPRRRYLPPLQLPYRMPSPSRAAAPTLPRAAEDDTRTGRDLVTRPLRRRMARQDDNRNSARHSRHFLTCKEVQLQPKNLLKLRTGGYI